MKYSFYIIKNKTNAKCYVGMTKRCFEKRFKEHIRYATSNHDINNDYFMPIYNAIRKYGMDSFIVELIEQKEFETHREAEIYEGTLIRKHTSMLEENGYNLNNMINSGNRIYSKSVASKIQNNNTKENNPFFGKKHSESTKRVISEKAKERLSVPQNNSRYGYRYTEQDKEKHRKAKIKHGKPFYADGVVFNTLGEASIKYGLTKQAIKHRISSKKFTDWFYI